MQRLEWFALIGNGKSTWEGVSITRKKTAPRETGIFPLALCAGFQAGAT
jgi:hypothetical protein